MEVASTDSQHAVDFEPTRGPRSNAADAPPNTDSAIWRLKQRPIGLLRHRTIRTKLLFGVVTLSAMTVILALTGLFGFYRYKSLAEAISQRATELPLATSLNQLAVSADGANTRVCRLYRQTHQGMIDSAVLAPSTLTLEQSAFEHAMVNLSLVADRYGDRIGLVFVEEGSSPLEPEPGPGAGGMLIDSDAQRFSLQQIRETIAEIERRRLDPRSMATYGSHDRNDLTEPLAKLVTQSSDHLSLMHGQMAAFSDHVQGQHHAGFLIACVVLTFALCTTVAMVMFFRNTVIKPFRMLVEGSQLVYSGNQLQHRIYLDTGDELGELADAMNSMADRFQKAVDEKTELANEREQMVLHLDAEVRQRSREVIRNEQLAGVGFLAAGFAHEINNPMATIAWTAESLESQVADLRMISSSDRVLSDEMTNELGDSLQRIQGEAFRCKAITEKMLDCSRLGNPDRTELDIAPLVNDVADMVRTVGQYRCKQLRVHRHDTAVTAHANDPEMRQVILNLITNALECVAEEGTVDVHVQSGVDRCGHPEAVVRVCDDGCGMTEEVKQHLFEPFFTRRRDGTGTGLGLSISSRIVSSHGGSLAAFSDGEGCGSEFVMRVPATPITVDETDPPVAPGGIESFHPDPRNQQHVQAEAA
ncbi:MAG: HAMP domain-containing sensor histidine kinase [Planctomycetota bacterium]